jgi:hypothetical protein
MPEQEKPMGKYLYCIIRTLEPRQFQTRGIGEMGSTVSTVNYMSLAAVTSDSPVIEYDNSRRNMMAHTIVLEEVMRDFTVLPVRFSTVAPTTEAIEDQVLMRRYSELNQLIGEMEGRVELGLKAFWYEGVIFEEIVAENPSVRRLRDSLRDRTPEESYYDRIRLGEMVEAAMNKKRDEDSEKILDRLRPLVYKTRTNQLITDRMVLNAAFLVNRDQEAAFDQAVQALDADMGRRMMFKYVGPVAPYNFVNIVVHWDEKA